MRLLTSILSLLLLLACGGGGGGGGTLITSTESITSNGLSLGAYTGEVDTMLDEEGNYDARRGTISITADQPVTSTCTVTIGASSSGTATINSDYSLAATTITLAPNIGDAQNHNVGIYAINDTAYEASETAIIEIKSTTCGSIRTDNNSASFTISSSDGKPSASLSVSSSSVHEHESSLTLTCTISSLSYQDGVCNIMKYSGSATEGTDFTTLQNITISAGNLSGTTVFDPIDDDANEGSEDVQIIIASVSGGISDSGQEALTITINEFALRSSTFYQDSGDANTYKNRYEFQNVNGLSADSDLSPYEYMNIHRAHAFCHTDGNGDTHCLDGGEGFTFDGANDYGKRWIHIQDFNCDTSHAEFATKSTDTYGSFNADSVTLHHCNSVASIAAGNFSGATSGGDIMGVAYDAGILFSSVSNLGSNANQFDQWKNATAQAANRTGMIVQNNSWSKEDDTDSNTDANINWTEANTFISNNSSGNDVYQLGEAIFTHGKSFNSSDIDSASSTDVTSYRNWINTMNNFQDTTGGTPQGGVIIFASGNYSGESDVSFYGALPELHPELAEAWLSVGMVEITGTSLTSSGISLKGNKCGTAREYCLVTDGFQVKTAAQYIGGLSFYNNSESGSSLSAPMVAGAIALLSQAFPRHTSEQLVDRLLASANNSWFTPEGNTTFTSHGNSIQHGYHSSWGHGIPDLYAAMSPITSNQNPASIRIFFGNHLSQQSSSKPLNGTLLQTPNLFGDSLSQSLNSTVFYFYDALHGGFRYPILNLINESELSRDTKSRLISDLSRLNFSISKPQKKYEYDFHNIFSEAKFLNLDLSLTINSTNAAIQNFNNQNNDQINLFSYENKFINENQRGIGVNKKILINNKTILLGYHDTRIQSENIVLDDNLQNLSLSMSGSNYFDNYTIISGILREEDSLLGAKGNSAFSLDNSNNLSTYVGLNLDKQILENTYFKGVFFMGRSEIDDLNNNFIVGAKNIYSTNFGVQLNKYETFYSSDKLSLFISQPHRIDQGIMKLKLPILASYNGEMNYLYKDISLAPSGRQFDFGVDYTVLKNENTMFGIKGLFTKDINHVASNSIETYISLSAKIRF